MASNVVVIDSSARRATVKTTPGTYLSDVLQEACRKLGYKPENFGLKHNNKQVDLSRTYRLSGLVSGAKLELVQLSKSAGVVSVALQLPESEARGQPNARLTDKFPSNTTLWLLLRKFEAGVAGGAAEASRNFTARSAPSSATGAGRLFYEQPVLHILNRELSSFTDLQKTLAQLGLNTGTALIRLSFKPTQQPLEDALQEIQAYFDSLDGTTPAQPVTARPTSETPLETRPIEGRPPETEMSDGTATTDATQQPQDFTEQPPPYSEQHPQTFDPASSEQDHLPSPTSRPISVYRPPTGTTPSAALTTHSESDFTPTVEHAQAHQKMLSEAGRNRRLKTDAELAALAAEEAEKLAAISDVEIKIRFPDQSSLGTKIGRADTGEALYKFVREECLDAQFRAEPFLLGVPGGAGKGSMEVIPDIGSKRLIQDLGLKGRVLLVFAWDEKGAISNEARAAKSVLREELRARAVDVQVPQAVSKDQGVEEKGVKVNVGKEDKDEKGEEGGSGGGIGKKMPKWLKGLSKK